MREDLRDPAKETWDEAEDAPAAPGPNDHVEAALRQARQDPLQHRIL